MKWRDLLGKFPKRAQSQPSIDAAAGGRDSDAAAVSSAEGSAGNYHSGVDLSRRVHLVREVDCDRILAWLEKRELSFETEFDSEDDAVRFRLPFSGGHLNIDVIKIVICLSTDPHHLRVTTYARTGSTDRALAESAAGDWNHRRLWPTCYTFLDSDDTVVLAGESCMTVAAGASDFQLDSFLETFLSGGIEMVTECLEAMQQFGDLFPPQDEGPSDEMPQ